MQPAVHPKPIRLILEVQASELQGLVLQILERFTPRASVAPPRPEPDPDDDEDDEPAPLDLRPELAPGLTRGQAARNLPPPVAHSPPMPLLPPHVAKTRYLGKPCMQGHRYHDSSYNLRKKSNNGCVQCARARDLARKQARQQARRAVVTALPPPTGTRPELPPHLALTTFLSPITCTEVTHRWRGLASWTLRYLVDEACVMCVTQQSAKALAGD